MNFPKIFLLLFILFLFCINLYSQFQTPVAVIDLDAKGMAVSATISLSNIVRKELMQSGKYIVVERNKMKQILDEHGLQMSGACTDLTCIIQAGEILGVKKMIGGSIGQLGKKYIIDLQIVDVENGQIEKLVSEDYVGPIEELDTPVKIAINRIIGEREEESKGTCIYVSAQPEGAKVYLNDIFRGNSPLNIQVEHEGDYIIKVKSEGYSDWQQKVAAKKDETIFINSILVKIDNSMSVQNESIDTINIDDLAESKKLGLTINEYYKLNKSKKKRTWGWIMTVSSSIICVSAIQTAIYMSNEYNQFHESWGIAAGSGIIMYFGVNFIIKGNKTIKELNTTKATIGLIHKPEQKTLGFALNVGF